MSFRGFLRRVLFDDKCPLCKETLGLNEEAICRACLKNLEGSSLKRKGNIYYLWSNEFWNLRWEIGRRPVRKALAPFLTGKLQFIVDREDIEAITFEKGMENEFFSGIKLRKSSAEGKKGLELIFSIFIDSTSSLDNSKIYFSLFNDIKSKK